MARHELPRLVGRQPGRGGEDGRVHQPRGAVVGVGERGPERCREVPRQRREPGLAGLLRGVLEDERRAARRERGEEPRPAGRGHRLDDPAGVEGLDVLQHLGGDLVRTVLEDARGLGRLGGLHGLGSAARVALEERLRQAAPGSHRPSPETSVERFSLNSRAGTKTRPAGESMTTPVFFSSTISPSRSSSFTRWPTL